jgi:hypothetical protein
VHTWMPVLLGISRLSRHFVFLRSNEGFPPDSTDNPTFANQIHHMHPLFYTGNAAINLANHGTWTEIEEGVEGY